MVPVLPPLKDNKKNIQAFKIIPLRNLREHNWFLILQKRVIDL